MADPILDLPAGEPPVGLVMPIPADPSSPSLLPGWRSVARAVIRVAGEEGSLDLVALHPGRGVALIAFLDDGEVASPEEARSAFLTWLGDEGFHRRFPGELPVVALAVPRQASTAELAKRLDLAFAATPAPGLSEGWVDWLGDQLVPSRAAKAAPVTLVAAQDVDAANAAPVPTLTLPAPSSAEAPPPEHTGADRLLATADAPPQSAP